MQNFTLGKRGLPMLLFALTLLIGSSPTFGQACPTVVDEDSGEPGNQQTFCYLSTVEDIQETGTNTAVFQTDNENDTQPISPDELLSTAIYYVGSTTEDCDRVAVEVEVNSGPRPMNRITNSRVSGFEFTSCASETFSDANLESLFLNDENYTLEVYESEFDDIVYTGPLTPGQSYFVGQKPTGTANAETSYCPSLRTAVRYNPTPIEGPTATSPQTFCEGATVANLEATGTYTNTQAIRWYRSLTGNEPLPDNTQLINNQTYYAGQVVNDSNSPIPPCETPAADRTPVTVKVIPFDAGPDSIDNEICKAELDARLTEGESGEQIFLSYLGERAQLEGTTVTFDPTIAVLGAEYQTNPFQTFSTTATFTTEDGCEDEVQISLEVNESYDAGEDNLNGNEVCRSDFSTTTTEEEVENYLISLLSVDFDEVNGSFSNIDQIVNELNSGDGIGDYSSTYSVGAEPCGDSALLAFTVSDSPNFELVTVADLCNDNIPALVNEIPEDVEALFLENFGDNIPDGEFEEGDIQAVIDQYNQQNIGTFTVTYIFNAGTTCTEIVELSRTVIEGELANAGSFNNIEDVCTNDDPIDFTSSTNNDQEATQGGTFSGEGVNNNIFDPSTVEPGTYTITYTVDESLVCVEGSAETTFTIEVIQGPISATVNRELCVTEANELMTNEFQAISFLTDLVTEAGVEDIDLQNGFDSEDTDEAERLINYLSTPSEDSETFTFTYSDVSNNSCDDGIITINITIQNTQEASTEPISDIEVCTSDENFDLNAIIGNNSPGGTFTMGDTEITNGFLDVSEEGEFPITYTVSEDDEATCLSSSASTEFTVTVNSNTANAGSDNTSTVFCRSELAASYSVEEVETFFRSLLSDNAQSGGTFSPDFETIANDFNNGSGVGVFSTTYTVGSEDCQDSASLSVTINETTEADAGTIANNTVCSSDEAFNLNNLLTSDNTPNGTFRIGDTVITDGLMDVSEEGVSTITYTVSEDDENSCVTGSSSTEFTVTVSNSTSNAGSDNTATVFCRSDLEASYSAEEVEAFFRSLLSEDAQAGGTFSPDFEAIADNFNKGTGVGVFSTTYSVGEGDCQDSATLSVTVNETEDADAGTIENVTVDCESEEPIVLASLPNGGGTTGGTFSGEGVTDGNFDPSVGPGTYTITYSVDETADCVVPGTEDSTTFTITVQDSFELGAPIVMDMCITEVQAMLADPQLAIDLFNDAIAERTDGDLSGEFSPSIETLAGQIATYLSDPTPSQTFETTYSVSTDCGDDSVLVSLNINDVTEATTGDIADFQVCGGDSQINLFDRLTDANTMGGTFSTEDGEIVNGLFDVSQMGDYTVIYTVSEDQVETCVEGTASTQFTVTVTEGEEASLEPIANSNVCLSEDGFDLSTLVSGNTSGGTFTSGNGTITGNNLDVSEDGTFNITYTVADSDPTTCLIGTASETFTITVGGNANAGADNSLEVCNEDVENLSNTAVRNLYLDLLDEGVSTEGTFNPTIAELMTRYNTVSNFGDFTTTYTVGNGDCQDSAVLTVTVIEANDAGEDMSIALCTTGEAVDLFDYLSPLATTNGTFEGFEDGVFDPAVAEPGDTVITYEVPEDDSVCSTGNFTATFTITVSEPVAANAGDDVTIEYCSELNEDIALSSLLSEGAIVGGTFSAPFANGTFNPSVSGEGEYVVTYTLDGEACITGTDSSTITITVVGATEAPVADAEQTFCFVDAPTVGDIVVTGDGVVIYEDAELTTPAEDTDPLVNGASYFASFSESAACASGVTMITVTIQDSDAPTLVIDGDEFCRQDNPTVQELINNLNGTGIQIYSAVTGGTALATTTLLEDGVTYFASGTDSEGACESSERLAVQVEVDFCGIPEGFSPNGDNINDFFVIPDIATDYPNYDLEVYNRWGSLVFEGNASTGDWDGTSNQSATLGDGVLPTGFYFYILNYNDGSTEPVQGKVYLSR